MLSIKSIAFLLALVGGCILYMAVTMNTSKLTPEEKRVIIDKGTEPAFSGIYDDHYEKGVYFCKQCQAPLYRSEDKFKSGTGWPSFDDAIPNAVGIVAGPVKPSENAKPETSEIVCANCGGHLGHVFYDEGFTDKNTRHCVNSVSLNFFPADTLQRAIFAGGCFWGVEYYLQQSPGVLAVTSGYIGGTTENPTYDEVCNQDTGHIEAVEVLYDAEKTSYETLARLFFEIHDPTQVNRQGPDVGYQYLSAIFYLNEEQRKTSEKLIALLKEKGYKVATKLIKAETFWPAEIYHQDYYFKTGKMPYCHSRVKRF